MQKINVCGKEYNIAFNVAVEIEYEDVMGEPFGIDKMAYTKNSVALYYASLKVNNKEFDVAWEEFKKKLGRDDMKALSGAVIEEMGEWLRLPEMVAAQSQQTGQDEEKNG